MNTRLLSTQEISTKLIPQNYLHNLLQPDLVPDSKVPAPCNVSTTNVLPTEALLSVNPPNLAQGAYQTISEANYLHSNIDNKRDLSYIMSRTIGCTIKLQTGGTFHNLWLEANEARSL